MGQMCPMEVPQTKVSVSDLAGGAALDFATTPDGVAELRRRVAAMVQMHNSMHQDGGAGAHHHGMDGDGGAMVSSHAAAEDTPQGARLVLHARNPGDVTTLRAHVREHAVEMQKGKCPMMQEMGAHGSGEMHHAH